MHVTITKMCCVLSKNLDGVLIIVSIQVMHVCKYITCIVIMYVCMFVCVCTCDSCMLRV